MVDNVPNYEEQNQLPESQVDVDITDTAKEVIRLIDEHDDMYMDELKKIDYLQEFKNEAFNTDDPTNLLAKLKAFTPFIVILNAYDQMALPDIILQNGLISEKRRAMVQSALESALEKMGWNDVIAGTGGGQSMLLDRGDAFISFGSNIDFIEGKRGMPFSYKLENGSSLKFPIEATTLKSSNGEREVRKMVSINTYNINQAYKAYPELKEKGIYGKLKTKSYKKYLEGLSDEQIQKEETLNQRIIQIAKLVDLDNEYQALVAGQQTYLFQNYSGKEFLQRDKDGNPDLFLEQLSCYKIDKGIFNRGMLHPVYRVAKVISILRNQGINWTVQEGDTPRIVQVGGMNEKTFESRYIKARILQKKGELPVIFTNDKESVSVNSLNTQGGQEVIALANQVIKDLEIELQRMVGNLDMQVTDHKKTLGQIELEFEASTARIRSIQKQNSPAYKRLVEMAITSIKNNVSPSNKTKLEVNAKYRENGVIKNKTSVMTDEGKVAFTLGDLAQEFKNDENYSVKIAGGVVNPRTYLTAVRDRVKNGLMQLAQAGDQGAIQQLKEVVEAEIQDSGIGIPMGGKAEIQQPQQSQKTFQVPQKSIA